MLVKKLSWSGVKIEVNDTVILIDPVEDFRSMEPYMGKPTVPVYRFRHNTKADLVLLTHLHPDHYDNQTIQAVLLPGGRVLTGTAAAKKLAAEPFPATGIRLNESIVHNGIRCTTLFSLDGIGDDQIAWLVEANGVKLFHAGDTIWHNQFWHIGKTHGPIDLVFLPINGVRVTYPFVGYTPLPASLLPEQAAVACRILGAKNVVPMHYNLFHSPPLYTQYLAPEESFLAACARHKQAFHLMRDGDEQVIQASYTVERPLAL